MKFVALLVIAVVVCFIQKPHVDYSRFSHGTHATREKLACDSCHKFPTKNWNQVRKGDAAFPDVAEFPEHASCLNCHRKQFFARERPAPSICANCHVNVTPRDTARFLFPSLGDVSSSLKVKIDSTSEFVVSFPHAKHGDVECSVCHQTYQPQGNSDEEYVTKPPKNLGDNFWLKKGSFKTIPNSHTGCFVCHNADAGIPPAPSDCNVCHKLVISSRPLKVDFDPKLAETIGTADLTIMANWRRRFSSGTFRHEGGEHPNINCLNCHNIPTMNTTDRQSLRVPVRTCGGAEGCHITATSDDGGILNYEIDQRKATATFVCAKCHLGFGKEPVPASHVDAILKIKK